MNWKPWARKAPASPPGPTLTLEVLPGGDQVRCLASWPQSDSQADKERTAVSIAQLLLLLTTGQMSRTLAGGVQAGGELLGDRGVANRAVEIFLRALPSPARNRPLVSPLAALSSDRDAKS